MSVQKIKLYFEITITHLGDSSPLSSSPRTPCLNTVSNMPAVWYLKANALSLEKKPICRLIITDIQKKTLESPQLQHKLILNL